MIRKILILALSCMLAFSTFACADKNEGEKQSEGAAVTGDYYLDLTELGMKLTIYLRLKENGEFIFSNTPAFEVDKSSGTYQSANGGYLMVYSSVNAQPKTAADGLTSKFIVNDAGELDFSVCERVHYGSAGAKTVSEEDASIKLIGKRITENYNAASTETQFTKGFYSFIEGSKSIFASFFGDDTYLIFAVDKRAEKTAIISEVGRYGVSTTSLALTPQGGDRIACEVVDEKTLDISVPEIGGERSMHRFTKHEGSIEALCTFSGEGKRTGTDESFQASLIIFSDGSFESEACGFNEKGLIALDTEGGSFKIYPDHPETGERGISLVGTVPSGKLSFDENGTLTLAELRIRTSSELSRDKCDFNENR